MVVLGTRENLGHHVYNLDHVQLLYMLLHVGLYLVYKMDHLVQPVVKGAISEFCVELVALYSLVLM